MIKVANSITEIEEIKKYAERQGFEPPYSSTLIMEKDIDKNIQGVIGIDNVLVFEPLISKSALISNNLYHVALGLVLNSGHNRIECFTTDEQYKKIAHYFERKGFEFLEKTNRFIKFLDK